MPAMSQISGLVHDWSPAEDDRLLRYVHNSMPGGRFEGMMELTRWPIISENMTRSAPALGLKGSYSSGICAKRYTRYILPRMTLAAAQNHPGLGREVTDALDCINSYEDILEWIGNIQLAQGNFPQPGGAALGDLVTWDYLVNWAVRIQEYPSQMFIEPGKILEFAVDPEAKVAEKNKMGIRAQYDLDYFNEILGWARNIVRLSGREGNYGLVE